MTGYATWLPDVLVGAGLTVRTYPGWETRGHYAGGFDGLRAVVWHHDASAVGDSPGVPAYLLEQWGTASAQLWVDRAGVWHVVAAGPAYHAGRVLPGMPGNHDSLGVETDHTTGEAWPVAQRDSLRTGTAAILRTLGVGPEGLHFHRTICAPPGRKTDPDGLDLVHERQVLDLLIPNPPEEVDVTTEELRTVVREEVQKIVTVELAKAVAYLHGEHALILHGTKGGKADEVRPVSLDAIARAVGVPGTRESS